MRHKKSHAFLLHPTTTTSTTTCHHVAHTQHATPRTSLAIDKPRQPPDNETRPSPAHVTSVNDTECALHVDRCHVTQPPPRTDPAGQQTTTAQSTTTRKRDGERQSTASTQRTTSTAQQPPTTAVERPAPTNDNETGPRTTTIRAPTPPTSRTTQRASGRVYAT